MSKYTLLVEVEVDRESGKFASRDEIFEKLEEYMIEVDMVDLSGLGADGTSEYIVVDVSVKELDSKSLKQVYIEYAEHVIADLPGDEELRKENRHLRSQLKELNRVLDSVKDKNIALQEEQDAGGTRIYQRDTTQIGNSGPRTYLRDGIYDVVTFQYGKDWDENFAIHMDEDGNIRIRNNTFSTQISVIPQSSNEILIKGNER